MPIKAIKTEIKQLVLNLIKNSFEAIADGGELAIRTRELWYGSSREIEILFVDTGCGIQENNPLLQLLLRIISPIIFIDKLIALLYVL